MENKNKTEKDNVKMNLTLPRGFYELLVQQSGENFIKTATWVKQYLMKHLLVEHKADLKERMKNENQN